YKAIWDALEAAGIPFTCHWGQLNGMTPERLSTYFGPRVQAWKSARTKLLGENSPALEVFAAPILKQVGLDGVASTQPPPVQPHPVIFRGSRGPAVALWQAAIGVGADGIFGPATETATRSWQAAHNLSADGVVGPASWATIRA
ncbi:MAG TPA: peptidoglycan-binding domain-containing protein, partial [Polyangiaceae bacterium]|nr:peptidoglycan-binding domain-containing protein [Polyangiaceae bacterium]